MVARMFLIDYGDFLPEIPIRSCLRKLPNRMTVVPRPLAFKVVLAGLRPISWDMNNEICLKALGKGYIPLWSDAANEMVTAYYKKSKLKLAEITNWQKDSQGRVYGDVELLGFTEKISLNDILIRTQMAQYSAVALKHDTEKDKKSKQTCKDE